MHGNAKDLLLLALSLCGAFRVGSWWLRERLAVLTYHRVIARREGRGGREVSRPANALFSDEFEAQVRYLAQRHHFATGEEVRGFLTRGDPLPSHSVLITFDDGYENNYSQALPILARHGATAMFFVTTGSIGQDSKPLWFDRFDDVRTRMSVQQVRDVLAAHGADVEGESSLREWVKALPSTEQNEVLDDLERRATTPERFDADATRLMTWDQVRGLAAAGMTIGSHTASHSILSRLDPPDVHRELRESRATIEREIGAPCWAFTYPNGQPRDFRASDRNAVASEGYSCAFTQISGFVRPGVDPYTLPRISIPDSGSLQVFRSRLSGIHHWLHRGPER